MAAQSTSDTPASTADIASQDEGERNKPRGTEPQPWILRPRVRATIYSVLVLFLAGTLAWGIVPRLLDPEFTQHIENKTPMVGMTREQVLKAWGSPYQTNISHTSEGIRREEWIYEEWISSSEIKHRYLYFEEGVLVGGWYYD